MARVGVSICIVAILSAAASADRIVLADGRSFIGTVSVEDQTVFIKVSYGTLKFPKAKVLRIEFKATPEAELGKKLAKIDQDDPGALFELADWASQHELKRHAEDIYARILKIDPDHGATRRALGYVKVDGQWRTVDLAIELAHSKLEAGCYKELREQLLPQLQKVAPAHRKELVVGELVAQTQLRAKEFVAAAKSFRGLADGADGPKALRFAAVAEILEANAGGMYVLVEAYPPGSDLFANAGRSLKPGPASLAKPVVLEAALWERAKKHIETGRKHVAAGKALESSDPDSARAKYALAGKAFHRAESLVPGIARTHRVEIARRHIAVLRKGVDGNAKKFDELKAKLGQKDLSPQAYRNTVVRLVHYLDNVRSDLKGVLQVANPYRRDLVLEVKWAEFDLERIEGLREVLTEELDGRK